MVEEVDMPPLDFSTVIGRAATGVPRILVRLCHAKTLNIITPRISGKELLNLLSDSTKKNTKNARHQQSTVHQRPKRGGSKSFNN